MGQACQQCLLRSRHPAGHAFRQDRLRHPSGSSHDGDAQVPVLLAAASGRGQGHGAEGAAATGRSSRLEEAGDRPPGRGAGQVSLLGEGQGRAAAHVDRGHRHHRGGAQATPRPRQEGRSGSGHRRSRHRPHRHQQGPRCVLEPAAHGPERHGMVHLRWERGRVRLHQPRGQRQVLQGHDDIPEPELRGGHHSADEGSGVHRPGLHRERRARVDRGRQVPASRAREDIQPPQHPVQQSPVCLLSSQQAARRCGVLQAGALL
mmetsp:Transcript_20894/g.62287  ORF Transcript_20894/g.62287 Transcript_20894/m.62287 type:complete len:261 (-) Transcript_20894:209-991(-)